MSHNAFVERLVSLAREGGAALSTHQADLIYQHVTLMLEWNRTVNLTRITDFDQILTRHILDSLLPGRWCPAQGRALDVGTGAGFPGVALKILFPDLHMTLLESHRKKASFLRVLQSRLQLQNLEVLPERWEETLSTKGRGLLNHLDLITMRAVRLEADHLTRLAGRLLAPGGSFAFWSGVRGPETAVQLEGAALSAGLTFQGCFPYLIPLLEHPRHLLLWKRAE
jgi:16S rRNA (guanine527-N7)-methyltransferase